MYKTPKDFFSGSENILRNFTVEILRHCVRENIIIKQEVVSFAVGLYCLDPQYEIDLQVGCHVEKMGRFSKQIATKLIALDSAIRTFELQELFMEKMQNVENIKIVYETRLNEKTEVIQEEILECQAKSIPEQDELFRLIVTDMIVSNKLGKPRNERTFLETTNALKSVFSRTDLSEFSLAKRKKRLETLHHLRELVCGIRLFNKDARHCGEGVRNIIEDVTLGFKNTKLALTQVMSECTSRINSIAKLLKAVFGCENVLEILDNIELEEYENLKDTLMLYTQHQMYIATLLDTLNQSKRSMDTLFAVFKEELKNVHEVVKFRIAIASGKVFPHFIRLHKIWNSLMTYLYAFVEINLLNDQMMAIVETGKYEPEVLHRLSFALKEKRVYEKNIPETVRVTNPQCKLLKGHELLIIPTTKYCAYLFVVGGGILVPSQPGLGILQYKNYYFAFCKEEYVNWFSDGIESYVQKFFEVVRSNPPIIVLFDCFDKILEMTTKKKTEKKDAMAKVKTVEVQTELHPIPYYKDKDYTWNIWDLRRKAIQLANIKNCKTHSTQTDVSYYRMNVRLETVGLNEKSDQTMRAASTNTKEGELEQQKEEKEEDSVSMARIKKCLWR